MKITKRQLRRIIREAQWGRFTGRAAPLDEPMRDSGPIPKDQLRKLADVLIDDMGMSPIEVLQQPEFVEQGITDLSHLLDSAPDLASHYREPSRRARSHRDGEKTKRLERGK